MKHRLILALTTALSFAVLFAIDGYYRAQIRQENIQQLTAGMEAAKQSLEEGIDLRILVVEDLRAFMLASPTLPESETFDRYAAIVLSHSPEARALQYVDTDHIIRYIYPLEGNEAALNLDLMTRPAVPFVEKAIQTKVTTVNDPTTTVQDSLSIVARSPIYDEERYLGLAQGVFDITSLLEDVSQKLSPRFDILLKDANGNTFWEAETLSGNTLSSTIQVGDNRWELILGWVQPEPEPEPYILGLIWGLGGALLISLLFTINQTFRRVDWLSAAVEEKTADLTESEARYRAIVEDQTELICRFSPDGRLTFANEAYCRYFGRQQEDILGRSLMQFTPPEDRAELTAHFASLNQANPVTTRENRNVLPGGEVRWLQWTNRAIFDAQGHVFEFQAVGRDITGRKRAEEAAKFQVHLLDTVEQAVMATDLDGTITYWNKFAEKLYGWSAAEVMGCNVLEVTPAETTLEQASEIMANLREGESWSGEFLVRRKDNTSFQAMVTNSPIYDDQGALVGIVGVSSDITERKRQEQELLETKNLLEKTFASLNEAVLIVNPAARTIVFCNPAVERIFGYSVDELIGKNTSILHVDQEAYDRFAQIGEPILEERGIFQTEFEMRRSDGQIILTENTVTTLTDEAGWTSGVVSVVRDITEYKRAQEALEKSEQRFRALIEHAPDGITLLNPEGTLRYVSPSTTRILGYSSEEVVGRDPGELIHPDDREYVTSLLSDLIQKPGDIFTAQYRIRHKDGSWRWIEATINNVLAEPSVQGIVFNYHDITSAKQLEEERLKLEKQFHQAQKMEAVGQLTAGIAHDFNNLLTAINGFAELMHMRLRPDDRLYAMADAILRAGSRAANLIRQLLIFSRKQIMAPKIIELNAAITEMNRLLVRIIGENIEVKLNLAPDLWPVKVDPAQIEQVVLNLAVNARDAMPQGGHLILETANVVLDEAYAAGHIEVRPGEYVVLTISDTGVGMSQEVQAHLFEPFFTTKAEGKGTGLGLATVYGIVKQSGGHIWVYSEERQGSSFKVYLPRTIEEVGPALSPSPKREVKSGDETILVVEDDKAIRTLTRDALKKYGYTLLEAKHGQQALQVAALHTGPIHLLLTDVIMPGMSGRALAEELAERYPQLKVVYMSGYSDEVISHHGILEPGLVLLQKPFSLMEMVRKVQEVLG